MRFFYLNVFLFLTTSVHANFESREAGCFIIRGQISAIKGKSLELLLSRDSRSEEKINILLEGEQRLIGGIGAGALIEISAVSLKAGPVDNLSFIADTNTVRFLSNRQLNELNAMEKLSSSVVVKSCK